MVMIVMMKEIKGEKYYLIMKLLKTTLKIDAIPINAKQPKAKKDEGTWTYIILTESPWTKSGGDNIKEYIIPIKKIKIRKKNKLFIVLFFKLRILFGKKFFNIAYTI